jgi:hypothetical protein
VVARGAVHERQPRSLADTDVGARDVGAATPRARDGKAARELVLAKRSLAR